MRARSPKLDTIQQQMTKVRKELQRLKTAERQEEKKRQQSILQQIAKVYAATGLLETKLHEEPDVLRGAFLYLAEIAADTKYHSLWRGMGTNEEKDTSSIAVQQSR